MIHANSERLWLIGRAGYLKIDFNPRYGVAHVAVRQNGCAKQERTLSTRGADYRKLSLVFAGLAALAD